MSAEADRRLPNGLTPRQDAAFAALAQAIAEHFENGGCNGCSLHSHPVSITSPGASR